MLSIVRCTFLYVLLPLKNKTRPARASNSLQFNRFASKVAAVTLLDQMGFLALLDCLPPCLP